MEKFVCYWVFGLSVLSNCVSQHFKPSTSLMKK
jgi:hypothetical protein